MNVRKLPSDLEWLLQASWCWWSSVSRMERDQYLLQLYTKTLGNYPYNAPLDNAVLNHAPLNHLSQLLLLEGQLELEDLWTDCNYRTIFSCVIFFLYIYFSWPPPRILCIIIKFPPPPFSNLLQYFFFFLYNFSPQNCVFLRTVLFNLKLLFFLVQKYCL